MRFTIQSFLEAKAKKEKITMLTAYDYSMSKIIDEGGVDAILIGDSLGMVVQGYESTLEVTLEDMLYHCKSVARGAKRAMLIGDMPFLSYHISITEAVRNAGRMVQEGKVHAVKLEGGRSMVETIKAIVHAQIPVMGHLGLTPQSIHTLGGFKVQGKDEVKAKALIEDALTLEEAGVFGIVLEAVPEGLAQLICEKLHIPVIGIGAGKYCDGQVLVINDMLGIYSDFTPKFVKQYANLKVNINDAVSNYIEEVKTQRFPEAKHTFSMDGELLEKLYEEKRRQS
ncbi:3-methyl-2-oxobutanoate hydroxymethyltransferase [Cellulosilyticum sp. I15G10I2]|uniref:3-methyl-2-oxobutanoate hydroxymethyltransferase n=1 Tax=Cellulosilyticum sp. I15G10I2 TaxID=1892843 RepID=UPI00085BB815|nr:3-methyl-2-oxobutanoate hydroxymethyltransferase [Cellulosilyticum sp. I15G10I2]